MVLAITIQNHNNDDHNHMLMYLSPLARFCYQHHRQKLSGFHLGLRLVHKPYGKSPEECAAGMSKGGFPEKEGRQTNLKKTMILIVGTPKNWVLGNHETRQGELLLLTWDCSLLIGRHLCSTSAVVNLSSQPTIRKQTMTTVHPLAVFLRRLLPCILRFSGLALIRRFLTVRLDMQYLIYFKGSVGGTRE